MTDQSLEVLMDGLDVFPLLLFVQFVDVLTIKNFPLLLEHFEVVVGELLTIVGELHTHCSVGCAEDTVGWNEASYLWGEKSRVGISEAAEEVASGEVVLNLAE